jgi:hypothetical protein
MTSSERWRYDEDCCAMTKARFLRRFSRYTPAGGAFYFLS